MIKTIVIQLPLRLLATLGTSGALCPMGCLGPLVALGGWSPLVPLGCLQQPSYPTPYPTPHFKCHSINSIVYSAKQCFARPYARSVEQDLMTSRGHPDL
jgi:hypothetical protein